MRFSFLFFEVRFCFFELRLGLFAKDALCRHPIGPGKCLYIPNFVERQYLFEAKTTCFILTFLSSFFFLILYSPKGNCVIWIGSLQSFLNPTSHKNPFLSGNPRIPDHKFTISSMLVCFMF